MTSNGTKLASASKSVKVWQTPDYSLWCDLLAPGSSAFSSVSWSWDSKQFISIADQTQSVSVVCIRGNKKVIKDILLEGDTPTFAEFSNTKAETFGVCTKSGKLLLWDITQNKIVQSFSADKCETTCLQFNWNDTYVAVGSSKGRVSLHNLATGQTNVPFGNAGTHAITCLRYSFSVNSLIGCTSKDGLLTLWDANTRKPTHHFPIIHVAPATSLRFSPTNPMLLISVGLDKKIVFYDSRSKKIVKNMSCGNALTALDFKDDGHTIALGDNTGKILIYDLRSMSLPINTVVADTSAIHYLAFQNSAFGQAGRDKLPISTKIYKSYANPENGFKEIPSLPSVNVNNMKSELKSSRFSFTDEIFSPVRDEQVSKNDSLISQPEDKYRSSFGDSVRSNASLSKRESLTIFSPLENSNPLNFSSMDGSPALEPPIRKRGLSFFLNQHNEAKTDSFQHNVTIENGSNHSTPSKWPTEKPEASQYISNLGCLNLKGMCSTKPASLPKDEDRVLTNGNSSSKDTVTVIPPSFDSKHSPVSDLDKGKLGFAEAADVDEGHFTGALPTPLTPQAFQVEYLKESLEDLINERMDQMRQLFFMQHIQMFKQMQEIQDNMQGLFSRYAIDLDLAAKVEKLEKENRILKNFRRS